MEARAEILAQRNNELIEKQQRLDAAVEPCGKGAMRLLGVGGVDFVVPIEDQQPLAGVGVKKAMELLYGELGDGKGLVDGLPRVLGFDLLDPAQGDGDDPLETLVPQLFFGPAVGDPLGQGGLATACFPGDGDVAYGIV